MKKLVLPFCLILLSGCSWVDNDFMGKPAWYWSKAAQLDREYKREHEAAVKKYQESQKSKDWQKDLGTAVNNLERNASGGAPHE